jgi:molybdopterin-containing oxidoreductase family membrane subunit
MTAALETRSPPGRAWIAAAHVDYGTVTAAIADPILERRAGPLWWTALGVSLVLLLAMLGAIVHLFGAGIGTWGVNTTVVWGYAIASYVWWIAIASGGTLISSMLLLTRQRWRASTNRCAETMTVFALAIAGLFPILHLGRPQYFYWLAPYPNTMALWPQWRSALVWDFWAILSYLIFSILFLYVGLVPDLATMRDRARSLAARRLYGALALGWRGSARHWKRYQRLHTLMACLAVPLVTSVHSIVGLDFAASLMPGWQESIFPPYFVVGALFSGFATVAVLAALVRWGLRLEPIITVRHFDAMAKVLLTAAIAMFYCYASEWFMAWYGGAHAERTLVAHLFVGDYAPLYWLLLICNVVVPQAVWFPAIRRSIPAIVAIAIAIDIGMWIERILIIWNTLSHDYAVSMWRLFYPTLWDWILLFGPLGFFAAMYLCAVRLLPAAAMHEMRKLAHEERLA